jgi:hypothetical protein
MTIILSQFLCVLGFRETSIRQPYKLDLNCPSKEQRHDVSLIVAFYEVHSIRGNDNLFFGHDDFDHPTDIDTVKVVPAPNLLSTSIVP